VGSEAVLLRESPTLRRNISPPYSESESTQARNQKKQPARWLIFQLEDGGSMILKPTHTHIHTHTVNSDIDALSGIRTHDHRVRAVEDNSQHNA
jgi:hypothetical protein